MHGDVQVQGNRIENRVVFEDRSRRVTLVENGATVEHCFAGMWQRRFTVMPGKHAVMEYLKYHVKIHRDFGADGFIKVSTTKCLKESEPIFYSIPDSVFEEVDGYLESIELYKKMGGNHE